MTDRRTYPVNDRVAHISVENPPRGVRVTGGSMMMVRGPRAPLCRAPDGARDAELLTGHSFNSLDETDGWHFGMTGHGYVGYVAADDLEPHVRATHRVTALMSHVYSAPDIKSPETHQLYLGAFLYVTSQDGRFAVTDDGCVPLCHIAPINHLQPDPAATALRFLGCPYLWGGDTATGIDCSGLVQAAWHAAGWQCPRDSDQQLEKLGQPVAPGSPLRRNDLVFWDGHVGLMQDPDHLIHANATHMAVVAEPLAEAETRIRAAEFGDVIGIRRVDPDTSESRAESTFVK